MSVIGTQSLFSYAIAALGQAFAPACPVQNTSDFVLTYTDPVTFLDTALTLNVDYFVTGAATNGVILAPTVTLEPAGLHYAVGGTLTLQRKNPFTQPTVYVDGVKYLAAVPNNSLDWLCYSIQSLNDLVSRCLQVPATGPVMAPMSRAARASKVVGFDGNGALTFYAFVGGAIAPQSVGGTANQVLVNGGTAPATGAVTLTLPQSINTGATVQFGKLGINGAAAGNSDITVNRSLPGVTAQASVVVSGGIVAPGGTDLHPNAFRDTTTFTPSVAADAYASFDAQSTMGGAVALNHYRGYQARHGYTGAGVLGEMSGFMTANMGLAGVGTITFMRSFYVSQPTIGGGGSVGQFDGIYMDALANATGNVNAIYIAGANRIFSAGGQIVTSVDLTPPAGATTARGAFTFDQATQTGLAIMNRNATATGTMISFCRDGGTVQGSVTQVNNTTVAYNTSSDARLKENVRDMKDSGAIIDALFPKVYDWGWAKAKNRGTHGGLHGTDVHGLVAQEVFTVFPEAVTVGSDELDANGNLVRPWGMDNSKFVPVLLAEVKDLRRRLAAAGIAA